MPITDFQRAVLRLLASNRAPDSYVAGATVINRSDSSPRFSVDVDIFNDPDVSVQACAGIDMSTLRANYYQVKILSEQRGFVRCIALKDSESVKLEWVSDTAFRFFPAVADLEFGYRLHDIDAAINKALALANRTEVRDVIDLLSIHQETLHLGLCCWAACGKDPGFTPDLILELLSRNARITPDLLAVEQLRAPLDPVQLKRDWLRALDEARSLVDQLPPDSLGCVFVNSSGVVPRMIDPNASLDRRFGSVGGCVALTITHK
jgi:hypothetical protein